MDDVAWLHSPDPLPGQSLKECKAEYDAGLDRIARDFFPRLIGKSWGKRQAIIAGKTAAFINGKRNRKRWSAYLLARMNFERPYREVNSVNRFRKWLRERRDELELFCSIVQRGNRLPSHIGTAQTLRQAIRFADQFSISRAFLDARFPDSDVSATKAMRTLNRFLAALPLCRAPTSQSSKGTRGPKLKTNPGEDRRISNAWNTGQYETYADCARALGVGDGEIVEHAVDRHRKREKRAGVK